MMLWTKDLVLVERIYFKHYGVGASMEKLCPTFEEFYAILGSDLKAVWAVAMVKLGYFKTFMHMLGLNKSVTNAMVQDNWINMTALTMEFFDPKGFEDPKYQDYWMNALAICLTSSKALLAAEISGFLICS
ncbi:conserved hypothetical protein [Ricinus communis]|uniref:Uncharacterized protein n=1 Tax=Ricinus communis TaxID=3988 RepID=B9RU88_RICCO|nr:conserved hypothetical protein [Ricinus communis]